MTALLLAEYRKTVSTKFWWALLLPAMLLALVINLIGTGAGSFASHVGTVTGDVVALAALAFSLSMIGVFALVIGISSTAGEFRHRTITTTYLTGPTRGRVMLAKIAVAGLTGAGYAALGSVVGVLAMLAVGAGDPLPSAGALASLCAVGVVVVAVWAMLGVGLGALISNQLAAIIGALLYVLLVENLLRAFLLGASTVDVGRYVLPGEAGDQALYSLVIGDPAGVLSTAATGPSWWLALLIFIGYAALFVAAGWAVGQRRDVT